jgi:large subunit ribosomal protein L13
MRQRHPDRVIKKAVRGMLPHNRLGRKLLKHLKVYAGTDHPHLAQQPKVLEV